MGKDIPTIHQQIVIDADRQKRETRKGRDDH